MSDFFSTLAGAVGTANPLVGLVTGIAGSAVTTVAGYFTSRAQFAHDEAMASLQLQATKLNAEISAAQDAAKFAQIQEQGNANAFVVSQQSVAMPGAVGAIINLFREALTAALVLYAARIYEASADTQLKSMAAACILNLTYMSVAFWFGTRVVEHFTAKKPDELLDKT